MLTTEFIEGIPLIEIIVALREGNTAYLDALEARGYDLDRIVRHLDWNMLNQVYVFGYFHADLHPANLFVLPGQRDRLCRLRDRRPAPDRMRESLTRYSWLLFRGELDDAVGELMRWLAPTTPTDATEPGGSSSAPTRRSCTTPGRPHAATPSPAPIGACRHDNPYSKLAVDIMTIIREHELTLSPSLVAYLKMLVTLGTLRHELATDYDLPATARRFFGPCSGRRRWPGSIRATRWTACTLPASGSSARSSSWSTSRARSRSSRPASMPCSGSATGCAGPVGG